MSDENDKHAPDSDSDKTGARDDETEPGEQQTPDESSESADEPAGWGKGDVEELKAENADLKDKLLRTVAEMENLRRRTERDKADTAKYAISSFARDVLTIADNIQRAIDHVPDEAAEKDPALKSFREGIQVTERELLNVMERHGIARLDPEGERFDPNKHQAMFEVPNPDVPEGTIVQVVQAGYVIADRVLRPAMVGVAKGGPKAPKPGREPDKKAHEPPKAANDDTTEAADSNGSDPEPETPGETRTREKGELKNKLGGKVDKSA